MEFFHSRLFAYLITVVAIAIAVQTVARQASTNTDKFVTLCQVQERFLNDVITVRTASSAKPGVSEAQRQVDLDAAEQYRDTLDLLHEEFPEGCE